MTQEVARTENPVGRQSNALWGGPTVEAALLAHNGHGPGFDTLRLVLSLAVLLSHAILLSSGVEWFDRMPRVISTIRILIVPAFFALGGFLVTASALRLRAVGPFLAFRSLRIFPALAVEVTLSALILGPIFTKLPLAAYFSAPDFWTYFGNMLGIIQFTLPGVFLDNPHFAGWVNGSLWTLRPDFYSYLLMMALMFTGIVYRRTLFSVLFALASAVLWTLDITQGLGDPQLVVPQNVLIYYFFAGVFAFHWRDKIMLNGWWALAAFSMSALIPQQHMWSYVLSVPVVYCVVYFGMQRVPTFGVVKRNDFSYGIYLYNCPILAGVVAATSNRFAWYELFVIGTVLSAPFALMSWKLIEKPSLKLKRLFAPSRKDLPRASA
ncbi:MAG: acyltransferase [Ramlibacter sp.]|nr:acyltransferase [Ramlibacter sp.]